MHASGKDPAIEIHTVDPSDEPSLRAWWEVGAAASAERPFDAWPAWEVSRRALPAPNPSAEVVLLIARSLHEAVGAGLLVLRTVDNTHQADVEVYVVPDHRRRGIGRALAADAEQRVRALGRSTIVSTVFTPSGSQSPGSLFADAQGCAVASEEETKLVDLAAVQDGWDGLADEVSAARGDYEYVLFEDSCPDEHIEGLCRVLSVFLDEIPTGDLDLEASLWTPERLRKGEQRAKDMGRTTIIAIALSPDREVCGFSDLRIASTDSEQASVGGTLVLPEHRGHRLGLGMKLMTHRRLLELFGGCRRVETGNATVNAAMNAVNERMGYRVVERALDVQKILTAGQPTCD
ncbi:MAG: GNAT family N-acetyltransferase [Nocardioides sp.]|nr:GNAT family N-acetyltransferase [Nocardioides sp.]